MGLKVSNPVTHDLTDDIANFFDMPEVEEKVLYPYEELKDKIYDLDIDNEEKANILNLINSLSISKKDNEKRMIIKEIESFKKKYKL